MCFINNKIQGLKALILFSCSYENHASSVPAGAEFGIYVSGDSMEPRYHSGQIVWVRCV